MKKVFCIMICFFCIASVFSSCVDTSIVQPEPENSLFYESDGLLQYELLRMEDVTYSNTEQRIYFTLVNEADQSIMYYNRPYIQKKTDGVWENVGAADTGRVLYEGLGAHSEKELYSAVRGMDWPGEYRIYFGRRIDGTDNGNLQCQWLEESFYIVGYFTVE